MSYDKQIDYYDYEITFEYELHHNGLKLLSWTAYEQNEEVNIPCVVESDAIERNINKWLDEEYTYNGINYLMDKKEARYV